MSFEPRLQRLHEDLVRIGHRPFHGPVGVQIDEQNPQASLCIRCATFLADSADSNHRHSELPGIRYQIVLLLYYVVPCGRLPSHSFASINRN